MLYLATFGNKYKFTSLHFRTDFLSNLFSPQFFPPLMLKSFYFITDDHIKTPTRFISQIHTHTHSDHHYYQEWIEKNANLIPSLNFANANAHTHRNTDALTHTFFFRFKFGKIRPVVKCSMYFTL